MRLAHRVRQLVVPVQWQGNNRAAVAMVAAATVRWSVMVMLVAMAVLVMASVVIPTITQVPIRTQKATAGWHDVRVNVCHVSQRVEAMSDLRGTQDTVIKPNNAQ